MGLLWYLPCTYGSEWVQTLEMTAYQWTSIASDSTGKYLAAVYFEGGIYTSSDYGITWMNQNGAPTGGYWSGIASDSTGKYLVVFNGAGFYKSSDYGVSWSTSSGPNGDWQEVVSDSTGQYLAAVMYQVGIYTSSNYGVTWTEVNSQSYGWRKIASDSTGKYLAAVIQNGGIYTSSEYGNTGTWVATSAPTANWYAIASDSSGKYLAAGFINGSIYTSSNYGGEWIKTSAPTANWYAIASDSTGQYLAAVVNDGGIYTSSNYGSTWIKTSAPSAKWRAIASDSTGIHLAVTYFYGGVYIEVNSPTGQPSSQPSSQPTQPTSQPTRQPSKQPNNRPTSQPSCRPTVQPSSRPSMQPNSHPTCQPSRQPTTQPSAQPTLQPSDKPSAQPTSQPTMQPSRAPSNQPSTKPSLQPSAKPSTKPTSNPTLKSHSVIHATGISSAVTGGYLSSTTVIDNIGDGESLFLVVKFLQTGFGTSSFTVSVTINDDYKVCSDCSVHDICGEEYVICCYNQDITSTLSNAVGGQLSIVAKSNIPFESQLCGVKPYFKVDYAIAKGAALPTFKPTFKPTETSENFIPQSSSGNPLVALIESIFIPLATVLFLSAMVVFGTAIHYGRKQAPEVEPLSLTKCVSTFVMFGGGFLSQIFSLLVFFNGQYDPSFGSAWLSFRMVFVIVGALSGLWLFSKHSGYKEKLDWVFLAKNKKLYGFVVVFMAFNPNFMSVLPWQKTDMTAVTLGFPSANLCYFTLLLSVIESLILTSINTAFAIDQKHLFDKSALQQFEFFFSLSFTCVNGIVALVECSFLGQVKTGQKETEMSCLATNPLRNDDIEAEGSRQYQSNQALYDIIEQLQSEKCQMLERLNALELANQHETDENSRVKQMIEHMNKQFQERLLAMERERGLEKASWNEQMATMQQSLHLLLARANNHET